MPREFRGFNAEQGGSDAGESREDAAAFESDSSNLIIYHLLNSFDHFSPSTSTKPISDGPTIETYERRAGGACLAELHGRDLLQCTASSSKFWTKVHLKAQPTCIDGRWLKVEGLTFETKFDEPAMDFAVSYTMLCRIVRGSSGSVRVRYSRPR